MRILLVEDDNMIGEAVQTALKASAYAVDWVKDVASARHSIECHHYDLALLDLGLPGQSGITLLQTLRAENNPLPVLIITARDSLDDRLHGLDSGADDYLVKPFAMSELQARIRAILRRKSGGGSTVLANGVLSLDLATHEACVNNGKPVLLTNREFALLQALMTRPGAILSRSNLEERIYSWGEEVESNAIEFIIHTLRKKLGSDTIRNVRGAGWMVTKAT